MPPDTALKWLGSAIFGVLVGAATCIIIFFLTLAAALQAQHMNVNDQREACHDIGGLSAREAGIELCMIPPLNEGTTNDGTDGGGTQALARGAD